MERINLHVILNNYKAHSSFVGKDAVRTGGHLAKHVCCENTKNGEKHSKRKITLKVEIHGKKPTTSEAIQAYGKGIITFLAEKPNT